MPRAHLARRIVAIAVVAQVTGVVVVAIRVEVVEVLVEREIVGTDDHDDMRDVDAVDTLHRRILLRLPSLDRPREVEVIRIHVFITHFPKSPRPDSSTKKSSSVLLFLLLR